MKRFRILSIVVVLGIVLVLVAVVVNSTRGSGSSNSFQTADRSGVGGKAGSAESGLAPEAPAANQPLALEQSAAGGAAAQPAPASQPAANDQQLFDRLVIKTADLSLQVENVTQAEAAVRARAQALGGYVVKVQTSGADDYINTTITFRVPANRFDDALAGVEGMAKKVLSHTVGGDDVTEQYVDLDSRLRNLEATRDRLLTFLNKADKVEDALAVNQSLTEVQGQIEQIQGRKKYLEQSAAVSTITVALAPVPPLPQLVSEENWQPLRVARDALRSLIQFGQGIAEIAIVLLVWSPVWGVLLLVGLWLWRKLRGMKRASAPETA
jgi:hypothetical protein